jgi:hypothetical protein
MKKSVFGGRKNLLPRENAMVSVSLRIAGDVELDAWKSGKSKGELCGCR